MSRSSDPLPRSLAYPAPSPRRIGAIAVALLLVGLLACWPIIAAAAPPAVDPPEITAPVGIVVEYPSGRVLFEKDIHRRMPEASTTKIMTALLVLSLTKLDDKVTIVADDLVGESTMGLVEGETQRIEDLLYGLMLPSGNDAAMALARYVGGTLKEPADAAPVARFVALMNRTAVQMGLADTHFVNPNGLHDEDHYTSVYDLASITWYAFHDPRFNKIVSTSYYNAPNHPLRNTNEMLTRYEGADGVKTGWTSDAGLCLVASAKQGNNRMISVVLNAARWYDDSTAMLDYGFAQPPANPETPSPQLNIAYRAQLLWFLANGLPTPLPTPPPNPPTTTPAPVRPAPTLAAGGGPGAVAGTTDPAPPVVPPANNPPAANPAPPTTDPAVGTTVAGDTRQPITLLPWVLAGGVLLVLLLFTRWQRRREPTTLVMNAAAAGHAPSALAPPGVTRRPLPLVDTRPLDDIGQAGQSVEVEQATPPLATPPEEALQLAAIAVASAPVEEHPVPANPQPPAPISPAAPADPRPWRSSLLAHDDPALHAARAIAMAERGYEGSSLSEFLMTLDIDPEFAFDNVPGFYDMPPLGYMALARAYLKHERPRYAHALLRLGLDQYKDDPYLAHFLHALDAPAPDAV